MTDTTVQQDPIAVRADLIAHLEARQATLKAASESLANVLLGQGWVVMSFHGVTMTYDVDQHGNVGNPRPAQPHEARRFTRHDATIVARNTQDGTGKPFKALHVADAVEVERGGIADLLASIKEVA
jgi:hypothetical protein